MRVVNRPACRPMRCAALPQIGQTAPNVRWIDTGSELDGFDNHVYLSSTAIVEATRVLGWPTRQDFTELRTLLAAIEAERDDLRAENERLEGENARLDAIIGGIDAIESADFRARRKAGRRPSEKTEVAA